jgi:hypothetical protein
MVHSPNDFAMQGDAGSLTARGNAAPTGDPGMPHARGTFEVKTTPVSAGDPGVASARLSLAKTFAGDLVGTSRGDMWTAGTEVQGSAGYVAIERIEGTLRGRSGSFALLHQARCAAAPTSSSASWSCRTPAPARSRASAAS